MVQLTSLHESHEEAIVEQHDQIEAEPAHPVTVAEIGVVDNGMVDDHQKCEEGTRAVERDDAFRCHVFECLAQHLLGFRESRYSIVKISTSEPACLPFYRSRRRSKRKHCS